MTNFSTMHIEKCALIIRVMTQATIVQYYNSPGVNINWYNEPPNTVHSIRNTYRVSNSCIF